MGVEFTRHNDCSAPQTQHCVQTEVAHLAKCFKNETPLCGRLDRDCIGANCKVQRDRQTSDCLELHVTGPAVRKRHTSARHLRQALIAGRSSTACVGASCKQSCRTLDLQVAWQGTARVRCAKVKTMSASQSLALTRHVYNKCRDGVCRHQKRAWSAELQSGSLVLRTIGPAAALGSLKPPTTLVRYYVPICFQVSIIMRCAESGLHVARNAHD